MRGNQTAGTCYSPVSPLLLPPPEYRSLRIGQTSKQWLDGMSGRGVTPGYQTPPDRPARTPYYLGLDTEDREDKEDPIGRRRLPQPKPNVSFWTAAVGPTLLSGSDMKSRHLRRDPGIAPKTARALTRTTHAFAQQC
ncbi:uncharacterized protein UV8b_04105 [Ustilaginoidea virens]|uniref:Uncharacterized protein n=1 Tax=Ustilaginoidea virens TaxID=1159556 RepID=A0A8E5HQL8_USTVR|nr:uncharacterized protein UV8b_04105 [Ustilaginoidea virens]QUC19864.1 hypothetical protein UV8b_04105 [Ustilaginoidea virens]